MYAQPDTQNSLVLSYLTLRRAVGCIGIALPFVLAFGKMLFESPGIFDSISYYYHSSMRNIFVGSLCAIAVFLLSYRGYDWLDDLASDFAGVCAIGIALFPTTLHVGATQQEKIVGIFHLFFAGGFMLTLAFIALFLFTKTDQSKKPTRRKQQRNAIYLASGITMVVCLVLIGLIDILPDILGIQQFSPIFWLESIAVVAFGISWFVKGQMILKDTELTALSRVSEHII